MKARVILAGSKEPIAEAAGLPIRVTTFSQAKQSSKSEVVVILEGGKMRSIVYRAGEVDIYLSPRARFRMLVPTPAEPADEGWESTEEHPCCDHRNAEPGKACPDCGARPRCKDAFLDHQIAEEQKGGVA